MGVKEVKLKELLLVFRNGANIKQFEGAEGLPITRIETISDATINPLKVGYANIFDDKYQDYYLKEGDILLSHINSVTHLGKCAIYINPIGKLIHGMNLLMLRTNKDLILPKYLYYVLNSKQFKVQLPKITKKSVNQASMTVTDIGNLKLLIEEDLEQQQKIVEILDKADEIRAKKKLANDKLDEFLKSTFISMFGDPVKNDKNYTKDSFGKGITTLSDYHANGSYEILRQHVELLSKPDYALMIRTTDLENRNYTEGVNYITEKAYNFLEKSKIYGGEIIINKIGSAGKVYFMPYLNRPVSLGMNAFLLRFDANILNNVFVYYMLVSDSITTEIQKRVKGAVTKTITKDAVREIPVIYPPIEDQNKFAQIVEHVEAQKQKNELVIEQMNNLFNSLSQRAFKGEL